MSAEIKVRKPKAIKFFGISIEYERYNKRWYKWRSTLPMNGDKIRITWLPDNKGHANAYIGIEGTVKNVNINEASFTLECDTSMLCGSFEKLNYVRL